ncbi:LLM class flavin-dependent oxidoreductase [Dactylosporangium sp. CA-233914]|uniref:LLM class flavin-dependent oxidoreductase n=1 Tax=Dactylosporangium sp. CA-233914 TaxID=3239934 RepID=UPI003D8D3256
MANAGLWRPDLLAPAFRTADQISTGRVEIGVGGGASPGGPAKPLRHLRDAVAALRAPSTQATGQSGWLSTPPFLIAGAGDRFLRAAGELADIVGITGPFPRPTELPHGRIPLLSPSAAEQRIAAIRAGAGDRSDDLELNISAEIHIANDRRAAGEAAQQIHVAAAQMAQKKGGDRHEVCQTGRRGRRRRRGRLVRIPEYLGSADRSWLHSSPRCRLPVLRLLWSTK